MPVEKVAPFALLMWRAVLHCLHSFLSFLHPVPVVLANPNNSQVADVYGVMWYSSGLDTCLLSNCPLRGHFDTGYRRTPRHKEGKMHWDQKGCRLDLKPAPDES